jgi:transposase
VARSAGTLRAYNRFNRWLRRGIWKRIFDTLAAKSRDSLYLIDSTIVKAHRAASGAKGGEKSRRSRQRGGRSTKIHAVVDSKGRPLSFAVTGGQVYDNQVVGEVRNVTCSGIAVNGEGYREILGICKGAKEDKAGWSAFLKHLKDRGLIPGP